MGNLALGATPGNSMAEKNFTFKKVPLHWPIGLSRDKRKSGLT